jgi:hypothetical protein
MQLILNESLSKILDLFLNLQLMVYVTNINLPLPALIEMVFEELTKLVNFDTIEPENLINFVYEEFSLVSILNGITS